MRSFWLWRVLLPSWRFFEAEDARFLLEVRIARSEQEPSPFAPALPPRPRGPISLVFAPEHNLRLACHDLIERFVLELGERAPIAESAVERLESYGRVREMVRYVLERGAEAAPDARFQLRLSALHASEPPEQIFLSPYYAVR